MLPLIRRLILLHATTNDDSEVLNDTPSCDRSPQDIPCSFSHEFLRITTVHQSALAE